MSYEGRKFHCNLRLVAGSFTDTNSFISQFDMQCILVYSRVNSNTRNPHFMGSSDDTDSNFTSISHKNFIPAAACSSECTSSPLGLPANLQSLSCLPREANHFPYHDITLRTCDASRPPQEQRLAYKNNKSTESRN